FPMTLDELKRAEPVYETLQRVKAKLTGGPTALIGFAGAPWTVASYMIEGGSSKDFAAAKAWAYESPTAFQSLIDSLVEATAAHLIAQVEAGAEALQIFDSWAGAWPEADLRRWCLLPGAAIIQRVKAVHPRVPVILFPRGVGAMYEAFARESGADALSLDTTVPLAWARRHLQAHVPVQGNLDPLALLAGGEAMESRVRAILDAFGDAPFVFNLGHGVVPATPPEHVARLIALVRGA
ncbi:MAG: uroporphyrinogen decarboxylase family protein, partial [Kiloniellaceae bacterium]